MIKKILLVLVVLIALLVAYLLFWPVSISPEAWNPPPAPALSGSYQQNNVLATVEKLSIGEGFAPEDVAIDAENRVYAGMDDGRIVRLQIDTGRHDVFANTQGRPLGLIFDSAGNLIVADTIKGLLSISKDGVINVLT